MFTKHRIMIHVAILLHWNGPEFDKQTRQNHPLPQTKKWTTHTLKQFVCHQWQRGSAVLFEEDSFSDREAQQFCLEKIPSMTERLTLLTSQGINEVILICKLLHQFRYGRICEQKQLRHYWWGNSSTVIKNYFFKKITFCLSLICQPHIKTKNKQGAV